MSRVRVWELGDDSVRRYSQLKMPGGGCWVTTGQFSSSLLSPQLFSWLQISEPRRKQFPLVQWNLHSAQAEEARVWEKTRCGHQIRNWNKVSIIIWGITKQKKKHDLLPLLLFKTIVIRDCAWFQKVGLTPCSQNPHKHIKHPHERQ